MALPKFEPITWRREIKKENPEPVSKLPKFEPIVWSRYENIKNTPEPLPREVIIRHPEPIKTPPSHAPEVTRLITFFETYKPKPGTLKLNVCTTIHDQEHFIKHCIDVITNNASSSRVYESEVHLLKEYYQIVSN